MENRPPQEENNNPPEQRPLRFFPFFAFAALAILAAYFLATGGCTNREEIKESFFYKQIEEDNIAEVTIGEDIVNGKFKKRPEKPVELNDLGKPKDPKAEPGKYQELFVVRLPTGDKASTTWKADLLANKIPFSTAEKSYAPQIVFALIILIPTALVIFFFISLRRRGGDMMGGGFLSGFSKSTAKRYEPARHPVTFKEVAGLKEVKADLMEIVEYLKNPDKFRKLGGRIPRGVLLAGPPGTGKTLLARAVAGEAGVPFFSVNGSEFIQMFVGVGASRVRDLFQTARQSAPSIIFIDEVDAIGRQRGTGVGGGDDERQQTLNQILSEMDGFNPNDAAIVVAATNRPDVLDPALLRPGRFDRLVFVGRPNKQGRLENFKVHVREVPLSDDVDLEFLATHTVGMTGADIRNIVNEAALWAARHDKSVVEAEDFQYAIDKVRLGAKREITVVEKERKLVAYHEAGHCLLGWTLPGSYNVHKVTIIPRGRTGGMVEYLPDEDKMNQSKSEMIDLLTMMLGGRAAELVIFNELSAGAQQDLEQATGLARRMVTQWGMSERLGPVSYKLNDEDPFLGREMHKQRQFSDRTMELIDEEVARILHEAADRALELLTEKRATLETLAEALLEREELNNDELTELIGPSIQSQNAEANGIPIVQAPREPEPNG